MTTYGEIVEPGTRTAWEDWDDVSPQNDVKLQWQCELSPPTHIESLLIFEGKYLYDCITLQSKCKVELINTIKEVGLNLYKIESVDVYLCVIKDYNLLHSSEIVELLKQYLAVSNDVLAVQTKPLANYQSIDLSHNNCVVRTLCTTAPSSPDIQFPKLEQPNIISGLSAGAICLREHLGLPGKAIICYVEHPEEYQVEEVQKLLKKLNIVPNDSRPSNVLNSNLYI